MPLDPLSLSVSTRGLALRRGAVGPHPVEAATELLVRHRRWLTRSAFVQACVRVVDEVDGTLTVDWDAARAHADTAPVPPADRAVLHIAVQLADGVGDQPDPPAARPPLGSLLPVLQRDEVDLVLAAVAHASGTHHHVEHVGEPTASGEWRITDTSPRFLLGSLHPWPAPAGGAG